MRRPALTLAASAAIVLANLLAGDALAERVSDIANTPHNLSTSAPVDNTIKSTTEDEICVFCHTPHAATQGAAPLWNRQLSGATYDTYSSKSLDADPAGLGLDQPAGSSKLCLSCHDGTIAIGQVNVLDGGLSTSPIAMTGTQGDGTIGEGGGETTGFTRRLGTDLTNDHPISFTYDDALATSDGEVRQPSTSGGDPKLIDSRAIGYKPKVPLENGQLQCTTCHDPHVRDTDPSQGNIKFLRLNRFQKASPGASFSADDDQICLACHTKEGWSQSAHALPSVAGETYTDNAADTRQFPRGMAVWQAGCLNCHDTHTVQGARRLLREGTTGGANSAGLKSGGSSAIEETCYQCHSKTGTSTTNNVSGLVLDGQGNASFEVPDIKGDFQLSYRMPIDLAPEVHDIGDSALSQAGKDFLESPARLNDRHVECTDCHNPHRVRKNALFNDLGDTSRGTHDHPTTSSPSHSNIASGVLRGSWGVEPVYSSNFTVTFGDLPTSYAVKRGDPGTSVSTDVDEPYVTREYQICLKCHSSYAYGSTPPLLGYYTGGTPSGTNNLTKYTDQAMEFAAPLNDQGEPTTGSPTMTGVPAVTNNHRSWHPVMAPTGRTAGDRDLSTSAWKAPWSGGIGTQTMYCSDCHGSNTASDTVVPNSGNPWGPHGSTNPFLLKGAWKASGTDSRDLCLKCHNPTTSTGFNGGSGNLHSLHDDKIDRNPMRCNWCHVAVPHGWKNKALLANLNKVGPEAGYATETSVSGNSFTKEPYYMNAYLRIRTWKESGNWSASDCGSSSSSGREWMRNVCENPP